MTKESKKVLAFVAFTWVVCAGIFIAGTNYYFNKRMEQHTVVIQECNSISNPSFEAVYSRQTWAGHEYRVYKVGHNGRQRVGSIHVSNKLNHPAMYRMVANDTRPD